MFKITFAGPEAGKIQKMADTFRGQLRQAVGRAVKNAESLSKKFYLSGPNYRGAKNPTPGPDGILGHVTGRLKQTVRSSVSPEGQNPIQGTLTAGQGIPYARIHEKGGQAGRNKSATIPKRSYLRPAIMSKMWVIDPLKKELDKVFRRFNKK